MFANRVLSGMRPTGALHLGHYHGVLKNWVKLQHEYECLYFVADWHALTTHYDTPEVVEQNVWEMVIDWLASGVDPAQATLFIQSRVPEHAELHLLLSMITPLGWLERVPTYKEMVEQLGIASPSYGLLGYPGTANSLAWGVILGVGAFVALLTAQTLADRLRARGGVLAGGLAFAGAFATYQAVLVVAAAMLASGSEAFSLAVVGWVLRVNLLSLAGLLILYRLAGWIGLVTREPLGARATVTAG